MLEVAGATPFRQLINVALTDSHRSALPRLESETSVSSTSSDTQEAEKCSTERTRVRKPVLDLLSNGSQV